jgi:hypothetical protein
MFVQIIQGKVADRGGLHSVLDRWNSELAPGADGWLGTTAGVTPDGDGLIMARFASADAAARNNRRAEQDQWWAEASRLFTGDVTFHDSTDVETHLGGGSDDAGFVQVMQGAVTDPARMREVMRDEMDLVEEFRPEIIGDLDALHSDGRHFTDVIYFTSEPAAREGERKAPPPQLRAMFEEMQRLTPEVRYYDLPEPWLYSPSAG